MVGDALRHSVDNHVAGTRIKGNNIINGAVLRHKGDICNAADVLQCAPFFPASEQNKVRIRDEGAPCPPAAMSRGRKSATVVTPVSWAITDGSPI